MKVLSPAKLNLMLRILGRRADGYHLLQTYFQLLDWGDEMEFIADDKNDIVVEGEFGKLPQEENLIFKAAKLLIPHRQVTLGIRIIVNKKIPQGSGLGGGSSNAGTTLRVLNKIWQCQLSQDELMKVAIALGADVPLFILNQSAIGMGIGENLTPLNIDKRFYVLIFPNISISTADLFSQKSLCRKQEPITNESINDTRKWTNACFPVVLGCYPEIQKIYSEATKHAPIYLTGTGSTLFASFKSREQAQQFIQECPDNWISQLCHAK